MFSNSLWKDRRFPSIKLRGFPSKPPRTRKIYRRCAPTPRVDAFYAASTHVRSVSTHVRSVHLCLHAIYLRRQQVQTRFSRTHARMIFAHAHVCPCLRNDIACGCTPPVVNAQEKDLDPRTAVSSQPKSRVDAFFSVSTRRHAISWKDQGSPTRTPRRHFV